MARARGKQTLQIGLPERALDDLEVIAPTVGRTLGQRGLTANTIAAWCVQYVLSLEPKQQIKAIQAGITQENVYLGNNPGVPIAAGEGDGHGTHSGPVFRGGVAKAISGQPIPRKIDSGTKRRTKESTAAALELA